MTLLSTSPGIAESTREAAPWSYEGTEDNQQTWGSLSHLYAGCEMGKEQSPINIAYPKQSFKPPLEFHYKPSHATVRHDGHMAIIEIEGSSALISEGTSHTLKSITFHSPSGHEVSEKFYSLEIEMLHEDANGNRLMLSIFGELGNSNPALSAFVAKPPRRSETFKITFDPSGLLPAVRTYYAYRGSLTYPPCTEGVEWRILKTPITVSKEELAAMGRESGRNARLTQPVYMRQVEETGR